VNDAEAGRQNSEVRRQRDGERGAATGLTFDFHRTAVKIDDPPGLGEPQPQAAAGFAAGEKRIKDVRPDFRRNAWPGIADGEQEFQISNFRFLISKSFKFQIISDVKFQKPPNQLQRARSSLSTRPPQTTPA